jgi:ribosomal protein S18 acetylase RimI-like enzyme
MNIDVESLELATLDAVAPTEIGTLPGWLLPFDNGTVGRAISAVPLQHHNMNPATIASIEALYAARGLKTQFRVADVTGLSDLHRGLRNFGYTPQQPTLTLVGTVHQWPHVDPYRDVQLSRQPSDAWRSVYMSGDFDPVDAANRVRALSRSQCMVYASLSDAYCYIAAGTAAFSRGWASLHGMRTLTRARGMGCATALIAALGQEALARNIYQCFLQVDEGNLPALHLYRSLGFQTAWLYHYWRKSD